MRQLTLGAGDHGAGSCEPNRYQAVPPQRAIAVGNFLGNSKNPTAIRICFERILVARFESSPWQSNQVFTVHSQSRLLVANSFFGRVVLTLESDQSHRTILLTLAR